MSLWEAIVALVRENGLWDVVFAAIFLAWASALPVIFVVLAWRTKLGYSIVEHRHKKAETDKAIQARKSKVKEELEARLIEHQSKQADDNSKDTS